MATGVISIFAARHEPPLQLFPCTKYAQTQQTNLVIQHGTNRDAPWTLNTGPTYIPARRSSTTLSGSSNNSNDGSTTLYLAATSMRLWMILDPAYYDLPQQPTSLIHGFNIILDTIIFGPKSRAANISTATCLPPN